MSRVTVSELQHRPTAKSPWIVRWRVDGSGKARAFRTKTAADKYRSRLMAAEGERFDPATGEPVSWQVTETVTFAQLAQAHMLRRWSQWSAGQRKSAAEALIMAVEVLTRPRAVKPSTEALRTYLRGFWLTPTPEAAADDQKMREWLERWSLPLEQLTVEHAEKVLNHYSVKADGTPCSPNTVARRKAVLYGTFKSAVNRRQLTENPLDLSEWKQPTLEGAVDPVRVPSMNQVKDILTAVRKIAPYMETYGAMIGYAGLRPSEVSAIKPSDLTLPDEGWGVVKLTSTITRPGKRYSETTDGYSRRGLKKRKADAVREVPLPPNLVKMIKRHQEEFPPVDGHVFTNRQGSPLLSVNFSRIFARAITELYPTGPLSQLTPYSLRHAAASMMLKSGVSAPDVAERLGHSVDVLLRIYVAVAEDERQHANEKIEQMLNAQS